MVDDRPQIHFHLDEQQQRGEHQRTGQDGEGASITVPTPMC